MTTIMTRLYVTLLLVALNAPAGAEQFTIKCKWDPGTTITFDEETKRMIWEVPQGMTHVGSIDSVTKDEILFHGLQTPSFVIIWSRKTGSLDSVNDKTHMNDCYKSELRPVMPRYDEFK
jgi:hypothetical protein